MTTNRYTSRSRIAPIAASTNSWIILDRSSRACMCFSDQNFLLLQSIARALSLSHFQCLANANLIQQHTKLSNHPLVHLITFVYIHAASSSLALVFFPQFPYTIVDDDDAHPLTHTHARTRFDCPGGDPGPDL
uniref:(northern house mosquito) hypothetical protein n=1 Tax=Culex pipiens TaxID=7175 RepID=A0A8D8F3V9_CULPI